MEDAREARADQRREKREYQTPVLRRHGSFQSLTRSGGVALDDGLGTFEGDHS